MRLRLRHRLRLRFPEPARNAMAVLRLTPRSHEGQRVTNWRIDVQPDCLLKAGEDHFGNLVHTLSVPGLVSEMVITAQGELTSFDALGVVRGSAERLPVEIYLRDTALTQPDAALRDCARAVATDADNDLGRLHALMARLHEALDVAAAPGAPVSAAKAFAARTGDARDHAQVFTACARQLGIPARCASGFFLDPDGPSHRHAWAEAHVGGLGWVGFDPVHNICPQDQHVRVAVGLDALEATALRGAAGATPEETVDVVWLFGREAHDRRSA